MKNFIITGDTDHRSGIGQLIDEVSGPASGYFAKIDYGYGSGLKGIRVVLMCQRSELNLKRRVRLSKKDGVIYMNVMLDFEKMHLASPEERKLEVVRKLWDEVPEVLSRYDINDFNRIKFITDFRLWINSFFWK